MIRSDMNRAQIEKQIRIFKKKKFPTSKSPLLMQAIQFGSLDFAEYTQWETAFLKHTMNSEDVVAITKWLPKTNNYIVFAKLRHITPTSKLEQYEWEYTHKFFTSMIQLTKALLTHSITHKEM